MIIAYCRNKGREVAPGLGKDMWMCDYHTVREGLKGVTFQTQI